MEENAQEATRKIATRIARKTTRKGQGKQRDKQHKYQHILYQNFICISRSNRALVAKTNYCSFVRSVLRNGETDGQAVRTGEFGGTSAAMQRNGVFDNRQA